MNKCINSPSRAHLLRGVFYLVVLLAGTLTVAVIRPEAKAKAADRTLTFADRVAYQRAIEEVYWRHRIWPKERPDPKPSLDAVMSQAQLETKVADYLRKSQALEDYFQRPITVEQLQAEMDRMAQHTRHPEVLRELIQALGNDPFVVAECLARPALAERLLRSWYAYDERIHGNLKQRAAADLLTFPIVAQMKQLSGKYSEIDLVRSDTVHAETEHRTEHGVKLNSPQWDETIEKLAAQLDGANAVRQAPRLPNQELAARAATLQRHDSQVDTEHPDAWSRIKVGILSRLQEDDTSCYATAVLSKTRGRLKLATVAWLKEPLEFWLARAESQVRQAMAVASANYTLPSIFDVETACVDDWVATPRSLGTRSLHTAVWTGSEMIIWGGGSNTGGRYCVQPDPSVSPTPAATATATATPTTTVNPTATVRPTVTPTVTPTSTTSPSPRPHATQRPRPTPPPRP